LQQSLINAQYADEDPDRVEFLNALAESDTILSTAQLEKLWLELPREMTASGEVINFNATIVAANGAPLNTTVTRIGPFTAIADGQYLAHLPALNQLNLLPRQPARELLEPAERLQAANSGYVEAVVDSTRG